MLLLQTSKSQHGQSVVSGAGRQSLGGERSGPLKLDTGCLIDKAGDGLEELSVWWEGRGEPGAVFWGRNGSREAGPAAAGAGERAARHPTFACGAFRVLL